MMGSPFIAFYIIGLVLEMNQLYLVKMGILVGCYIIMHFIGHLLFDERLSNLLPMAIYMATKVKKVNFCSVGPFLNRTTTLCTYNDVY